MMSQAKTTPNQSTSTAFTLASIAAMAVGAVGYLIGLWNAEMELNEKGYYFTVLLFGMYSAISIQKCVRDRLEDIPVSQIYYGISWVAVVTAVGLLGVGLYNATTLALSEKGFYAMAYVLCLYTAVNVQKNTRDSIAQDRLAAQDDEF